MKNRGNCLRAILAAGLLVCATNVQSTLLTYDITVTGGGWFGIGPPPFGLPAQPNLSGTVTVDNTLSGLAAFANFTLATGTHTWTLAELVGTGAFVSFDAGGNLTQFALAPFVFSPYDLQFFSNNAMNIRNNATGPVPVDFFACNGCISFARADPVPEPATAALVAIAVAGALLARRRIARAAARAV